MIIQSLISEEDKKLCTIYMEQDLRNSIISYYDPGHEKKLSPYDDNFVQYLIEKHFKSSNFQDPTNNNNFYYMTKMDIYNFFKILYPDLFKYHNAIGQSKFMYKLGTVLKKKSYAYKEGTNRDRVEIEYIIFLENKNEEEVIENIKNNGVISKTKKKKE